MICPVVVSQAHMALTEIWPRQLGACTSPLGAGMAFSHGDSSIPVPCWINTAALLETLLSQQIGLICSLIVYRTPCIALLNYIKGLIAAARALDPWAGCAKASQVL